MSMLEGKRILITGVTTHRSIAFAVAREAQRAGAEIILTTFGTRRPMTVRAARRLQGPPPVLELDVREPSDVDAVAAELEDRWGALDGVVHSIAFASADALSGDFLAATDEDAIATFRTSALSLRSLAVALAPLLERAGGGSIVAMGAETSRAWPHYNWMGVAKAGLASISRYLARDLGPRGIRVNIVTPGPLNTPAAIGALAFPLLSERWEAEAPLGWDCDDPTSAAHAVCFFLSDWSRGITGEELRVDGGHHAVGAPGLIADMQAEPGG